MNMMKKKILQIVALFLLFCAVCTAFAACVAPDDGQKEQNQNDNAQNQIQTVDYAASVKLDMSSSTKKQEVTVRIYVDGDTTHFNVPRDIEATGILKARYLAINTPESTGVIEEWGKAASKFMKSKLLSATSIIVESDDDRWNHDSNGRMLVWVWYRTSESSEYRNLNIEILQNGLAIASNSAQNRYGATAVAAIDQARAQKLKVYSGERDPDFYYGTAKPVTLKTIRTDPASYVGVNVVFEGVITCEYSNTIYVEEYDENDGIYYGFAVYYGYNADADLLSMFKIGNRVKLIGSVQYYEAGGTYQISGLKYNVRKPDESCALIAENIETRYVETDAETFAGEKSVVVARLTEDGETVEEEKSFGYAELVMDTTIAMSDLTVTRVYTTHNGGSSDGAMTLTCEAPDGTTVSVRTEVLRVNGEIVTAEAYLEKTIDVRGLVDFYIDTYQIRVFSAKDITVKD